MEIKTLSDLLNEFVNAETQVLQNQNIRHPTTIGTMFEGLTENILNKSIFNGLNLKVIKNSFIVGCDTEFDILLVEGEGERIPHTDRFIYNPEQVITIIQVKKNLFSKDVVDGYNNLKFLIQSFKSTKIDIFINKLCQDSFKAIFRKKIPINYSEELNDFEDLVLRSLYYDAILPVRIIWGYVGFKSEYNLRESFVKFIKTNVTTNKNDKIDGFGPQNFPNLIICGSYSILKQNGMPFIPSPIRNNRWSFLATSSYNPVYFFLELIWTRLSYKFSQLPSEIFGEDLTLEPANLFIDCQIAKIDNFRGWGYNYLDINNETLQKNKNTIEWNPVEIDSKQYSIIAELCEKGEIDLNKNEDLENYIVEDGKYQSFDIFLEKMLNTELVYIDDNKLKLLTENCQCIFLPDGKMYAGENKNNRLTRWTNKELDRIRNLRK